MPMGSSFVCSACWIFVSGRLFISKKRREIFLGSRVLRIQSKCVETLILTHRSSVAQIMFLSTRALVFSLNLQKSGSIALSVFLISKEVTIKYLRTF
jgi:hypothetical protein